MFETTLLFKTLTILSSQIAIVFGGTYLFITYARKVAKNGKSFFGYHFRQSRNIYNQKLDLVPYPVAQKHFPRFMAKKEPKEVVEDTLLGPKTKIEHEIVEKFVKNAEERRAALRDCLLYTSDAADE